MTTSRRWARRAAEAGFSYIELVVALSVLAILAASVVPMARWADKRRREARLEITLKHMRRAIDQYKKYADEGLIIQDDIEQMGYPPSLEELVEGVEVGDPDSPEFRTIKFLQRLPIDPFTEEADWGRRSYQDDFDSNSWGGENVYDVYSQSPGKALDGTYYVEW